MPTAIHPALRTATLQLAVIQFFFATCWVVYVIFLGDLLERVGIGRDKLIWFILVDQLIFAFSDAFTGYWADRMDRFVGRLGPLIIGVNAVSCLAFLAIPFAADLGPDIGPGPFMALILIWIATSSVLRAPAIILFLKHTAKPNTPRLAAYTLFGLSLGGAVAPFLGLWLKGMDPFIPFVLNAVVLFITTLGLARVQRLKERLPADQKAAEPGNPAAAPVVARLMIGTLLIAFGFQVQYFLNTKGQYLAHVEPAQLIWVLPLFWVGFKLAMMPGSVASTRYGAERVLALAGLFGGVGLFGVLFAPNLGLLIAAQMAAGAAYGLVYVSGWCSALNMGDTGKEGLILGLWFSMNSLAAVIRAGLVAGGAKAWPGFAELIQWVPGAMWLLGAVVLISLVRHLGVTGAPREVSA